MVNLVQPSPLRTADNQQTRNQGTPPYWQIEKLLGEDHVDRTTRIVTIGRDWTLQHSRTLLLRAAGYRVREARTENEVLTLISASRAGAIGLLLICHTVSENSRVRLVKAAKAKLPGMPILLLYNGWDRKLPQSALRHLSRQSQSVDVPVDGWLHCTDITPGALLSMVGLLISATPGRAFSVRSNLNKGSVKYAF